MFNCFVIFYLFFLQLLFYNKIRLIVCRPSFFVRFDVGVFGFSDFLVKGANGNC